MQLRNRFLATLLLMLGIITSGSFCHLHGQDESDASPPGAETSRWYVTTMAGKKISAKEVNVYTDGWLLNAGDDFQSLSAEEVFCVMNTKATPPDDILRGTISRVYLSNGDRLAGHLVALNEERLELKPLVDGIEAEIRDPDTGQTPRDADKPTSTLLKIPITSVRALEWLPSGTSPDREKLLTFENAVNQDVLKLSNGDQLSGEVTTIALDNLEFLDDQGSRTVPTSEVRALLINPELVIEPKAVNNYYRIALSDGSLLTITKLKLLDVNRFELTTVLAGTYQVPLEMLVSLSAFSENLVPLEIIHFLK